MSFSMNSSDLYVTGSVPNTKNTGATAKVTYAIGEADGMFRCACLQT